MHPVLRPPTADDVDLLAGMMVEFYREDPGEFPMLFERARQQVTRMFARPDHVYPLLMDREGEIIGYALLVPYFSNEFGGEIVWLDELFVTPEHRGGGIGSWFLEHLKAWTRERGIRRIELEVSFDNVKARQLYERSGFTLVERHLLGYQHEDPNAPYKAEERT